jgi:hypothetical protein
MWLSAEALEQDKSAWMLQSDEEEAGKDARTE